MYTLYPFARPFLFALDPETAHDIAFAGLDRAAKLGLASIVATRVPDDPVEVMGIEFPNRVGLAAGLDKNGAHVDGLATFGFGFFDRTQLAAAAKHWVARGFTRLKMTVGNEALRRRDSRALADVIKEDAARVRAVREAVGPDIELFIDANCNLDLYHAMHLAEMIKPYGIGFFEEPLSQNDVHQMAELRRISGMALACGQNEGLLFRFRDLLLNKSVDILQPNVAIGGGFTQCVKIAGMASAFNVPIANGGAWPFHNMHLHAGVANGGLVEYHLPAVNLCAQVFDGLPMPKDGWLTLPATPGLGFSPNIDRVRELAKRPLSGGRGKG